MPNKASITPSLRVIASFSSIPPSTFAERFHVKAQKEQLYSKVFRHAFYWSFSDPYVSSMPMFSLSLSAVIDFGYLLNSPVICPVPPFPPAHHSFTHDPCHLNPAQRSTTLTISLDSQVNLIFRWMRKTIERKLRKREGSVWVRHMFKVRWEEGGGGGRK